VRSLKLNKAKKEGKDGKKEGKDGKKEGKEAGAVVAAGSSGQVAAKEAAKR